MRRTLAVIAGLVLVASLAPVAAASRVSPGGAAIPQAAAESYGSKLLCHEGSPLCAETNDSIGYRSEYTGHDEPSALFYSNVPGSGNNANYRLVIPTDPPILPKQDGRAARSTSRTASRSGSGWTCATTSPRPSTRTIRARPNSDSNIFDGADPTQPDYIGFHPGTAFLEVQFYPPGWVPWLEAISCDPTKWCAAVAIFSFNSDQNNGVNNNAACLNSVGVEPANFAFITLSGTPHAPAAPLSQTAELVHAELGDGPVHGPGRRHRPVDPRLRGRPRRRTPR